MKVFVNECIISSSDWIPEDIEEFEGNIKSLLEALYCFQFFNESSVYYYGAGIAKLIERLELLDDLFEHSLTNPIDQLRQRLADLEAIDWEESQIHKSDYNYFVQLGGGSQSWSAMGTSLAEAAEYDHGGQKVVVLNLVSSEFNTYKIIKITRVYVNPPQNMTLHNINSICNKEETIKYYLEKRSLVVYNHNPKHGESRTGTIKKNGEVISPLECTRTEAEEFIKLTIGGENNTDLFAYDKVRNKYIRFKYDSIDNATGAKKYHGFYPHDQNIAQEVKKFLFDNTDYFK